MSSDQEFPYKKLGVRLKSERQKLQESLVEVSGAVEIELDNLTDIEQGKQRPAEDVLLLLINHFAIDDDNAVELWEMAGYNQQSSTASSSDDFAHAPHMVMMPVDLRIIYTDMAHVVVNEHGVVLNFMQTNGNGSQPMAVSRVGMSREHARSVVEMLQKTLEAADQPAPAPKALPTSKSKQDVDSKEIK